MQKNHKAPRQRTNGIIAAKAEAKQLARNMRKHVTVHRAYLAFATVSLGALLLLSMAGVRRQRNQLMAVPWFRHRQLVRLAKPALWTSWCTTGFLRPNPMPGPLQRGKAQPTRLPHRHNRSHQQPASSSCVNVELVAKSATSRNTSSHWTATYCPIERILCTTSHNAATPSDL